MIKEKNRAEILALRKTFAIALAEQKSEDDKLTRLSEQQQKLQRQIETLELSSNAEGKEVASELIILREQLTQCSNKIFQIYNVPAGTSVGKQSEITNLLRQFGREALAALTPSLESYTRRIASQIRPYCLDDENAFALACKLPACESLWRTYSYRFGDYGSTLRTLKAAIARADEILSGELNWSFDAKNNPPADNK
ncbi:MAG: hypothetical protein ABSC89_02145 [Verrucomicrobiota bacterium]